MLLFTTYYYWKFSQFISKNSIFMYRLKLAPAFNIILFLLCIIISQITNLYYVINKIIGRSVFYFFEYLDDGLAELDWGPKNVALVRMLQVVIVIIFFIISFLLSILLDYGFLKNLIYF